MAAVPEGSVSIFDGDIIQLYCLTESGYVYSEPNSKTELKLDVCREKIHIPDFAAFCITLKKDVSATDGKTENIFYGSVVSLQHQASELFLTTKSSDEVNISSEKEYFRVAPPNQEAIWGEELKDNDSIRLETISFNALTVRFHYKNHCYESSLKAVNGSVFAVRSYCHKRREQNPNSIKGGDVIVMATVLKIEAYMCAKDSFVANPNAYKLEPSPDQSSSSQERSPPCTQEESDSKIGFTTFMERPFNKLPEHGDTFFLIEKVKGRAGDPILFREQCRIKHLFTFQYISVTSESKVTICDLSEGNDQLFIMLPVCTKQDHEEVVEVCDSDGIIFQHIESSKYLSFSVRLKPSQKKQNRIKFYLTLDDSNVSQNQFKVFQVDQQPLLDCYYAIGISLFLCDWCKKLKADRSQSLIAKAKPEITKKTNELEKFLKNQAGLECKITRLVYMLRGLNKVMNKIYFNMPSDIRPSIKKLRGICKIYDNQEFSEDTDGASGSEWKIELHTQKQIYKKVLERFGTNDWRVHNTNSFKILSEGVRIGEVQLSMTDDSMGSIEKITDYLKRYVNCPTISADSDSSRSTTFTLTNNDVTLTKDDVTPTKDDVTLTNDNVDQLLTFYHLLYTKISVQNTSETADEIRKLLENSQILSQLIANENSDISIMSAELLFDIYTDTSRADRSRTTNFDNVMWPFVTMEVDRGALEDPGAPMELDMPLLEKMLTKDLSENSRKLLIAKLTECVSDKDKSQPIVSAQKTAYNCGLFHIILDYAVKHKIYSDDGKNIEKRVLEKCFELLQRITRLNKEVQNELFIYFNDFLQFKIVLNPMICFLNEIFFENPDVCNKFIEIDIEKIFYTAVIGGTTQHYQWTVVLKNIIEHSDYDQSLMVQECTSQLILEHSADILEHIFDKKTRDDYCHLALNIFDLLASCTKECHFARSVSIKFFTLDDLIETVANDTKWKLPFIRLLTWTYLATGCDSTKACSKLNENKEFWSHIKITIENFAKEKTNKFFEQSHWTILQQADNGKSTDELLSMMNFLYIIDGVIPFLSQFCHEMSSNKINCTIEELTHIMDNLIVLHAKAHSVHRQLWKFECIKKINLLLPNHAVTIQNPSPQLSPPKIAPEEFNKNWGYLASGTKHEEIVKLLKSNGQNPSTTFNLLLRRLIILHWQKNLSCSQKMFVEKMILRTLILLQEVVSQKNKQVVSSKKPNNIPKLLKELAQDVLDFSDSLCILLQHQNKDIIITVLQYLTSLTINGGTDKAIQKRDADRAIQKAIISSVTDHEYIPIVQVHHLLRESHLAANKAKRKDAKALVEGHLLATAVRSTLLDTENKSITVALDTISLLCDRQQKDMQNAMRENKAFVKGFNVVSQVTVLLFHISINFHQNDESQTETQIKIQKIAQKAIQALIGMCTGNYYNQTIAFSGQVVISINNILEKTNSIKLQPSSNELQSSSNELQSSSNELQSSCIELLEIMLEEIDENSSILACWIANHLKRFNLCQVMQQSWDSCDKSRYLLLLKTYHVLRRIAVAQETNVEKLVERGLEYKAMWRYCEHRSRSVEIVYKSSEEKEILTKAYFPYDPDLEIQKNSVKLHIKRGTQQEKLLDLLKWTNVMKTTHEQKKELRKKRCLCFCEPMLQSSTLRQFILVFLTILLNLFVIFSVRTPADYNTSDNEVCTVSNNGTYSETGNSSNTSPMHFQPIWIPKISLWSTIIMSFLGLIHAVLAVMMFLEYFARKWRHLKWGMYYFCQYIWYIFLKWLLRKDCTYQKNWLKNYKLKLKQPQSEEFETFFEGFQSLYRLIFMVCSCLAWIPYPTFLRYLYCVCAFYPFLHNDIMSYILRALKRSFKQLALVFLLCFAIIYIYAVISFALLNNYFTKERDQFCDSLAQCFITVLRLGLLSTLGSELDIRPCDDYKPDFTLYAFRTVYDIIFFIVITTLALNIIIAILVDRFSEMREKKDDANEDDEKRCFICGIERSEFDRQNKDFKNHVNEEHNMWNYIRFIIYVKSLSESEHKYNAVEKYVFDKMQEENDKLQPDTVQQNKGQSEAMLETVHVQQEAVEPLAEKKCHEKCCTAILSKLEQCCTAILSKLEQWIYEPEQKDQKSIDFFPLFRAKALPDYKPSESVSEERLLQLITKTEQLEKALEQVKKEVEKAN